MVARSLLALLLVACGESGSEPRIDQVIPPVVAPGARVDLLGQNFCEPCDVTGMGECALDLDGFVSFGIIEGTWRRDVGAWHPDRISLAAPASAAPGETTIVVTVRGRPSPSRSITIE